jgi:hypothetical protein
MFRLTNRAEISFHLKEFSAGPQNEQLAWKLRFELGTGSLCWQAYFLLQCLIQPTSLLLHVVPCQPTRSDFGPCPAKPAILALPAQSRAECWHSSSPRRCGGRWELASTTAPATPLPRPRRSSSPSLMPQRGSSAPPRASLLTSWTPLSLNKGSYSFLFVMCALNDCSKYVLPTVHCRNQIRRE